MSKFRKCIQGRFDSFVPYHNIWVVVYLCAVQYEYLPHFIIKFPPAVLMDVRVYGGVYARDTSLFIDT
jgi:hypothetical protein